MTDLAARLREASLSWRQGNYAAHFEIQRLHQKMKESMEGKEE